MTKSSIPVAKYNIEGIGNQYFLNPIFYTLTLIFSILTIYIFNLSFLSIVYLAALYAPLVFSMIMLVTSKLPIPTKESRKLSGKPLDSYMILDPELQIGKKLAMEVFFEAYFDEKIEIKMDCLELFENRYDWCYFPITIRQGWFFISTFLKDLFSHTRSKDREQITEHYDRGNDFYASFLGSPMIYTSGIITKVEEFESLDQLQLNKCKLVAQKLQLTNEDTLLDLGCGWSTWIVFAAKNFGVQVTGVTLSIEQHKYGLEAIKEAEVSDKVEILCMDARDIPRKKYTKISCLEMAEHVGVLGFKAFMIQIRHMLEDDGLFFLQIAGLRATWFFEDLVWGLFMDKYIFPGADASCPLNWVLKQLEESGFEISQVETIGVHYSATLYRWYLNWLQNKEFILKNYGKRWFRIWEVFLAWATIIARQGSASCYQILAHKNSNSFNRANLIQNHAF